MMGIFFMEWVKVYYNQLETNIEVTKSGMVRRVYKEWLGFNTSKYGEINFKNLKKYQGYQLISIQIYGLKTKTVRVHQLVASAFLGYKFTSDRKIVIDHIDSNRSNNHLNNLRVISQRENCSKERTLKKGLPVGVYFFKRDKNYRSCITINGKYIHLGYYNTIEDAYNAYKKEFINL